jgi:hypothetical protein
MEMSLDCFYPPSISSVEYSPSDTGGVGMDWSSLGHNLLANGIWALLVIGGGLAFGYLRARHADKVPIALYAILGATCVAILIFTFTGRGLFVTKPPAVTPENIEENVKSWVEHLGMNIGPANEPDSYFAYMLSLPNSAQPVEVFRLMKEKPGYLQFKAVVQVAGEHQLAFSKMSPEAVQRISEQLDLDIGRANLGCTFGQAISIDGEHHKAIITGAFLVRGVPIANLSEIYFSETFDQLTRGTAIVKSFIRLAATTPEISRVH